MAVQSWRRNRSSIQKSAAGDKVSDELREITLVYGNTAAHVVHYQVREKPDNAAKKDNDFGGNEHLAPPRQDRVTDRPKSPNRLHAIWVMRKAPK